jgi:CRP-like cAMP-binding protein
MSDVIGSIRERIRYHERELEKLKRMLEVAGADASSGSVRSVVVAQLRTGPKTGSALASAAGCKMNTLYVLLSRMRKQGLVTKVEKEYVLKEQTDGK